jgi:ATP-binding cassette subfamily D (ALD) protein 4
MWSSILQNSISAPMIIIWYNYQCWIGIGWFSVPLILTFFLLGYTINKIIISPIAAQVYKQEKLEGDLRFSHQRVQLFAESIVLYGGNAREEAGINQIFTNLLSTRKKIIWWHLLLNFFTNLFTYFGAILNYIIIAIPIFWYPSHIAGNPTYVSTATFACIQLISGYSQFLNISSSVSNLAGYTARISSMNEIMEEMASTPKSIGMKSIHIFPAENEKLEENENGILFENVKCFTPNGTLLFSDLSFSVNPGCNTLIVGPAGSGKTSILRMLNGLWPFQGRISRPKSVRTMFFLPQRAYLFMGTLWEQVTYPHTQWEEKIDLVVQESLYQTNNIENRSNREHAKDKKLFLLRELLNLVKLDYLLDRYDPEKKLNWPQILSPGEQQLISFARLFYIKPSFAILDEATSALPEAVENLLYEKCQTWRITLISVGHRSTLPGFHPTTLKYDEMQRKFVLQTTEKKINEFVPFVNKCIN